MTEIVNSLIEPFSPYLLAAVSMKSLALIGAVFVGVMALFWFAMDMTTKEQRTRAETRLDILSSSMLKKTKSSKEVTSEFINHIVQTASPVLARHLQPRSEVEIGKLRQRLVEAGFRSEDAFTVFLALKMACALGGLFLGGGFGLLTSGVSNVLLLRAFLGGGIGFYLPEFVLSFLGSKRKKEITLALPDCLDLLVVSVEAGLGLDQAIRKVSDEMKSTYPTLVEELQLSTLHLQMGRPRQAVLQELGARTGVDDVRALASLLVQADKFGTGVAQALRVQSDTMRIKRQQLAEEKAAKTAVKLIFPLVIFIFPGVFVVLVGPAAIQMSREMFTAMSGK
ncbi:MAG: type II secretion system F family protein [Planctomycetes bacterium]|nr:type II secretion system F family protein [Planctomycetota bacterium]